MAGILRGRRTAAPQVTIAGVLLLLATVVACSDDEPSTATSTASSSPTPDEQAVRREVVETYNKWSEVNVAVLATADYRSPELRKYLAEPLLTETINDIKELDRAGIVLRGRPTWTARVTSLRLDAKPPVAELVVCLDMTEASAVFKATGRSAEPTGQNRRYRVLATAKQVNGRWYIVKDAPQRSTPC